MKAAVYSIWKKGTLEESVNNLGIDKQDLTRRRLFRTLCLGCKKGFAELRVFTTTPDRFSRFVAGWRIAS